MFVQQIIADLEAEKLSPFQSFLMAADPRTGEIFTDYMQRRGISYADAAEAFQTTQHLQKRLSK